MDEVLTQEYVLQHLDYDKETGFLTRKTNRGTKYKIGSRAGTKSKRGYRTVMVYGHRHPEHRIIWLIIHGCWPRGQIDHINGVKDDNRLCNLRDVQQSENLQNQHRAHKNNKSGLLGARFHKKSQRWCSAIRVEKRDYWIGFFETAEEAHAAYLIKKQELHPTSTLARGRPYEVAGE